MYNRRKKITAITITTRGVGGCREGEREKACESESMDKLLLTDAHAV